MIKKIVSNAFLSLVMEKEARDKLEHIRKAKKTAPAPEQGQLLQQAPPKAKPQREPRREPGLKSAVQEKSTYEKLEESAAKLDEPDQLMEALNRLESALDDGTLGVPAVKPAQASAPARGHSEIPEMKGKTPEERRKMYLHLLENKRGKPEPVAVKATGERRKLILQALEAQRRKSGILDDLSDEDRLRLHLMAKKIMMGGKDGG